MKIREEAKKTSCRLLSLFMCGVLLSGIAGISSAEASAYPPEQRAGYFAAVGYDSEAEGKASEIFAEEEDDRADEASDTEVFPFTDIKDGDWYQSQVRFVWERKLFAGSSETTFSPNGTMTRAMMVQVLHNLEKNPKGADPDFTDVADGIWYAKAVGWAAENEIVYGVGDGLFEPERDVTRQEMAVILHKYCVLKNTMPPAVREYKEFGDQDQFAEWGAEAVKAMYCAGVLNGHANGGFAPNGNAVRAEVASMFMNYVTSIEGGELNLNHTTMTFTGSGEYISNPLMGFAPMADGTREPPNHELVYVDITWREWEPEENKYNVEELKREMYLDRWKSEGKHVVFRFICDKPGREAHKDIPDWLEEITDGEYYDISYGKGYAPNYMNDVFIKKHAEAIRALGDAFGGDTFFSYIQLGSLGHWGEWHVKSGEGLPKMPGPDICEKYIEPYEEAFPNAIIMMRRPFQWVKEEGYGVFNDMTGEPRSTKEWLDWIEKGGEYKEAEAPLPIPAVPNVWNNAPIGGEFTGDISMSDMLGSKLSTTVQLIRDSHMTYIGPRAPFNINGNSEMEKGAEEVLKNMGYRYGITKAVLPKFDEKDQALPEAVTVSLDWKNSGVAPMYWDWDVYLYFLNPVDFTTIRKQKIDIKLSQLYAGAQITTKTTLKEEDIPDVKFLLGIGIEDPMTNKPAVKLDMNSRFTGKIALLTKE